MSDKTFKPVILSQLEDALEERQSSERRKDKSAKPPEGVIKDRRKGNRREKKAGK